MENETHESDDDEPFTLTRFNKKEMKIKLNDTTIESRAGKIKSTIDTSFKVDTAEDELDNLEKEILSIERKIIIIDEIVTRMEELHLEIIKEHRKKKIELLNQKIELLKLRTSNFF